MKSGHLYYLCLKRPPANSSVLKESSNQNFMVISVSWLRMLDAGKRATRP